MPTSPDRPGTSNKRDDVTRRDFLNASAVAATAPLAAAQIAAARQAYGSGSDRVRVGLIGCGGRGTGAAHNCLAASDQVAIVALADVFRDRLDACREQLMAQGDRAKVADDRCYVGFDAYRELIASDLDMVILATPPHFRPMHLEEAIRNRRHVFMEKPVAVDPTGIRKVIAAADEADRLGLSIVAGTQRRHERSYLEAMSRMRDGAVGDIVSARCYWNMGGLWMKTPRPEWTDMEWQLRNWLYFTWLSGDHICEQHIHNLDVVNWAVGSHPIKAAGMGGRQVRTDPDYGHIFDHFAIEYEYPNHVLVTSMCRQTDGCWNRVAESVRGTEGWCEMSPGQAVIEGAAPWRFTENNPNPYVEEHRDLLASIDGSTTRLNEGRRVAESTLTAIMGRMSAYTGKEVTWEQAMNSKLDLTPATGYVFGSMPMPPVPMPGRTALI